MKNFNTGAVDTTFMIFVKACSCYWDHSQGAPLWVSLRRGSDISDRSSKNLERYFTVLTKHCTAWTSSGLDMLQMASTFCGSGFNPSLVNKWPINGTWEHLNMNFSLLSLMFLSWHLSKRFLKFLSWFCVAAKRVGPFPVISRSSKILCTPGSPSKFWSSFC